MSEENYYPLPKRRRLNNQNEDFQYNEDINNNSGSGKRKSPIMTLPTEVIQEILKYFTGEQLSNSVRVINRRLKILAEDLLNRKFKNLSKKLKDTKMKVISKLQASTEIVVVAFFSNHLQIIDNVIFHYNAIFATIWRYIYNDLKQTVFCMYGGKIIDLMDAIADDLISIEYTTEINIALSRMRKNTYELTCLSKQFSNTFEKVDEMPINKSLLICGAKLIDLLDASTDCYKDVSYEHCRNKMYSARMCFCLTRSWFVASNHPSQLYRNSREKIRLMFMRIRRMVYAHSEMSLEEENYKRSLSLLTRLDIVVRKPISTTYTGFGESANRFFCYGVMNESAYFYKLRHEIRELQQNNPYDYLNRLIAPLGVSFDIKIMCSENLAPYTYLKNQNFESRNNSPRSRKAKRNKKKMFDLCLTITSIGADSGRLPEIFKMRMHY